MTLLFDLQAVGVQFGRVQALRGCSLRIHAGEKLALVGANGSGKSTLLRTLHGLVKPDQGHFRLDARARQAMLFQRPYMLRASVLHNVALGLWLSSVPWKLAKAQALQALERVGLADLAGRHAKALSGGQQQRGALARGSAVILIDADLQDPPELMGDMVRVWQQGADVVNMKRNSRQGESWFKKSLC